MSVVITAEPAAFNTASHGTPDTCWDALLRDEAPLALGCDAIVVVSPHPDDEVLGAGGLIRVAAMAGHEVTILSVTDGEAAYPDWRGLGKIRRRELSNALNALAPSKVTSEPLNIPDGRVDQHRSALRDAHRAAPVAQTRCWWGRMSATAIQTTTPRARCASKLPRHAAQPCGATRSGAGTTEAQSS